MTFSRPLPLAAIRRASFIADHARRRLKLIRMTSAHEHARSQATNAMTRPEVSAKKRNHAATAQQIKVRSFQPAPPGFVSPMARARAIGARRIANDPKIRRVSIAGYRPGHRSSVGGHDQLGR